MHLLYADESGSIGDEKQKFFVMAGVSVFERDPHWIEKDLNEIAARFDPHLPHTVELHGSPMRVGKGFWRRFTVDERERAIRDALVIGVRQRYPKVRVFAVVLEKAHFAGADVAQVAFEQLSSRFDQYLGRLHKQGNTQRGLIVLDRCSTETRIQTLAREFRHSGHSFGKLYNITDVPLFVDSGASRLIQLADLVAHAIFRSYEVGDDSYLDLIGHCFDSEGGAIHGLYVR